MKREEAIELLEDVIGFIEDNQGRDYDTAFRMAIEALTDRPHGSWKPTIKFIQFTCSKCGAAYFSDYNYCPNCGAAMDISE